MNRRGERSYQRPTPAQLADLYRGLPKRWGGGIHKLHPSARSFFITLFTALNTLGFDPRSNYPHRPFDSQKPEQDFTALDVVDNSWRKDEWQKPSEHIKRFIDALATIAHALKLSVGRDYRGISWDGDDSAWAKAWRKKYGYEDVLHVEWYRSQGKTPPDISVNPATGEVRRA